MPSMVIRTLSTPEGDYHQCWLWCPGCEQAHPVTLPLESGPSSRPTWSWDGNVERPTFSPSLLARGSVHRCADEHLVPCAGGDCEHFAHRVLDDGSLATPGPHTADPAWGDCHSFIRDGQWEFLSDSAHALAGQTVPLPDLPDWLL